MKPCLRRADSHSRLGYRKLLEEWVMFWTNAVMVVLALVIVVGGLIMVFSGARAMGDQDQKPR
jgi:hypothetical protein